jgi:hypothetical protein
MAPPPTVQFRIFLPPGAQSRNVPPSRPGYDREANPRVQKDHTLGDYGFHLIEIIGDDYNKQIGKWTIAFKEITAAYGTAVGQRAQTFVKAKEERDADAATDALIFSLVVGGAMAILGAWVTASLVPGFKIKAFEDKWVNGVYSFSSSKDRFSALQAAAFGGMATDAGGKIATLAFPSPKQTSYPMDQPSVTANLDADFSKLIDDSAELVRQQMTDAKTWMNQGTEFGETWLAHAKGNVDQARLQIRLHFDMLRRQWAEGWKFFGTTPRGIARGHLAEQFERALWAGYIVSLTDEAAKAARKDENYLRQRMSPAEFASISKRSDVELLAALEGDDSVDYHHRKLIEAAIIDRLKELNVVIADTQSDLVSQATRMGGGSPTPTVSIRGAVNRSYDVRAIYGWATSYLRMAKPQSEQLFFPPATRNSFKPFPNYQ